MSIEFYNISSTLQIEWNKVLTLKFCKITAPLIIKPLLVLGRRSIMKENMNIKRANVKERDLIIIKGHFVHLNYGLYLVVTIIHIFHSSSPLSLSLSRLLKCQKKTQSQNTHFFTCIHYFGMSILDKNSQNLQNLMQMYFKAPYAIHHMCNSQFIFIYQWFDFL